MPCPTFAYDSPHLAFCSSTITTGTSAFGALAQDVADVALVSFVVTSGLPLP